MSLLVFLQFFVFVSVHACNARSLGVLHKLNDFHGESSISWEMRAVVAEVGRKQGGATTTIHGGSDSALFNGGKATKSNVNSQIDIQQEVQLIQEIPKQGRSLEESKSRTTDEEEAVESKEKEMVEDVVVMDYASPHRKPPIHNEKP